MHVRYTMNTEKVKYIKINLRIPEHLLKRVDDSVKKRVGINRTGWILETIHKRVINENTYGV